MIAAIVGGAVLFEVFAAAFTVRKYQKLVSRLTVEPDQLSQDARVRADRALAIHYLTSVFP